MVTWTTSAGTAPVGSVSRNAASTPIAGMWRAPAPPGHPESTVCFRHDERNLYLAASRTGKVDEQGHAIAWSTRTRGADTPVWEDDSIEIYITSAIGRADDEMPKFVHLGLSASGGTIRWSLERRLRYPANRGDRDRRVAGRLARARTSYQRLYQGGTMPGGLDRAGTGTDDGIPGGEGVLRRSSFPGNRVLAIDTASGDSLQLTVNAEEQTCRMERFPIPASSGPASSRL